MNEKEIILSDSSDDLENLPSFRDRVMSEINKTSKMNINSTLKRSISCTHSISDSEASDSKDDDIQVKRVTSADGLLDDAKAHIDSDDSLPDLKDILGVPYESIQEKAHIYSDDDLPDLNDILRTPYESVQDYKKVSRKEMQRKHNLEARVERNKQKELVKVLKDSEKEILKSKTPAECLKNLKIIVDHNFSLLDESDLIFRTLDQNQLNYCLEENNIPHSVVWYRIVTEISLNEEQVCKKKREDLARPLILMIPNEDLLKMVHGFVQKTKGRHVQQQSLIEFVVTLKNMHPEMDITCITIGYEKFMRNIKEQPRSDLKALAKEIHKNALEQALLELQLQTVINFHFLDNMVEFSNLLCQFTKSIGEAPLRQEKDQQKASAFSWYADMDSNCPIKLSKDGSGSVKLWQQQVQQFHNVGPEAAEAIVSRYSSPRLLLKAYKECFSAKEAEMLLQDIVVRRNYGPLGTQKRIGPELSYKLYLCFTSKNGSQILRR